MSISRVVMMSGYVAGLNTPGEPCTGCRLAYTSSGGYSSPDAPQRHRASALATSDSIHGPPVQNYCFASVLSIASLHEI